MAHCKPAHPENHELWEQARLAAYARGYELRRVQTNSRYCAFIGWHRYLAMKPFHWASIRSPGCVHYEEAQSSRYYQPTIHAEAAALARLRDTMNHDAKGD